MNAISENAYTSAWKALGEQLGKPRAILAISAHWYINGSSVTTMESPRTIHDFGGFPEELYRIKYRAPGHPVLARQVQSLFRPVVVEADQEWGLDHGTWSILSHLFPQADVPVVQLSIDRTQPPIFHFEAGMMLRPLRDEGVLILGSGNLVHNLDAYAWGQQSVEPYDWALRFEKRVRDMLIREDNGSLIAYEAGGEDALLSVPTPDHYLPFLYILGVRKAGERQSFPVEGFDGGSVSMLGLRVG